MPIQEATTVHATGTTTLAAGGIGVGDFATGAITADSVATDAVTEISGALTRIIPVSDSTAITSLQGGTVSSTYTLTVDETVVIHALEVTGDITSFSDAGDIIAVTGFENDNIALETTAGNLVVNIGTDGAANTIEVFASDWFDNSMFDAPSTYVLSPNTSAGFAVDIDVIETGPGNDANTAIPITVTFYISGSGASGASVAKTP